MAVSLDAELRLPAWCLAPILLSVVLVVVARRIWRNSSTSQLVNEFACSVMWLSWALERVVISYHGNYVTKLVITFLMVLEQPFLYNGACANPVGVFIDYLQQRVSKRKAVELVLCELAAVPVAIGYTLALWNAVGHVSSPHSTAHTINVDDLLQVSVAQGIILEALGVFLMLTPVIIGSSKLEQAVLSATILTVMDVAVGRLTGGFFNAMSALMFVLMYKKSGVWSELLVVYAGGSILGAIAAWKIYLESRPRRRWMQ